MLSTSDIRNTMTPLVFLCFWLSSSATSGEILSEVNAISASPSADVGLQGRLMRLRTCNNEFNVQCEPCEVIRIVNVSYAASGLKHRNPIHGCSDFTFQQEFDCLLSAKIQYFKKIKESCDGIQSCQLMRDVSLVSCGFSVKTWSCCVEIYYSCEPKNDLSHAVQFSANDLYGNVNNVSLQCESSDLSVDSVMWIFNSSREVNIGGVCYKVLPDTKDLKRRCERRGCSDVYVHGDNGCGGNEYVFNNGLYVCYICKHRKVPKTTNVVPTSSLFGPATSKQSLSSIGAEGKDRSVIATQNSAATHDEKSNQDEATKTEDSTIPSHGGATTTKLSEPTIEPSTRIISLRTTKSPTIAIASPSTVESSTTTEYQETTEYATTRKSSSTSSSHLYSATSEPKWSIEVDMQVIVGISPVFGVLLCLLVGCICCTKIFRRKNRVPGSGGLTRRQSRKRPYSYPEMSTFHLPLKDAVKRQASEADAAESGLQSKSENLNRLPIKQQASLICKGSLRVQDKEAGTSRLAGSLSIKGACKGSLRVQDKETGTSRLAGSQSIEGAEPGRVSQSSFEEQDRYSYPEMPSIYLQLEDTGKDKEQKSDVSSRTADAVESRLQNETGPSNRVPINQRVSTVCKVSPRVRDKLEETLIYDSNSNSNELTDYGTYLEFVADDAHEEGVGKGLEPAYAEPNEFRKSLEPSADVTKELNPHCVNTDMCREGSNIGYDTLDFICMSPVYEELNLETMDEYPVNIGY